MKRKILIGFILLSFGLVSCSKEDPPAVLPAQRTIFVYMPWSTNLLSFFETNLEDLETSIVENRIQTDRFLVFLSESETRASLFELKYEHGKVTRVPLKSYTDPPFTTAAGITSILRDVVSISQTERYAMIIGSHGVGWVPVSSAVRRAAGFRLHWEGNNLTRFFGGLTASYQTDITTLAQGIAGAGLHMEYILFDDCYMSNVETAYDLKGVADYLVGCPTEVIAYGFPYHLIGEYLTGTVDYEGVAEGFYRFYSSYTDAAYGTVSVTDCSQLDALAAVMHAINRQYPAPLSAAQISQIQRMDGYDPVLFFDLGDYVARLCSDPVLLSRFEEQLERTVPAAYKRHTPSYPTALGGSGLQAIPIRAYSGITVSDPSFNPLAAAKSATAWWRNTHD